MTKSTWVYCAHCDEHHLSMRNNHIIDWDLWCQECTWCGKWEDVKEEKMEVMNGPLLPVCPQCGEFLMEV